LIMVHSNPVDLHATQPLLGDGQILNATIRGIFR